jgi:hypothetical protein
VNDTGCPPKESLSSSIFKARTMRPNNFMGYWVDELAAKMNSDRKKHEKGFLICPIQPTVKGGMVGRFPSPGPENWRGLAAIPTWSVKINPGGRGCAASIPSPRAVKHCCGPTSSQTYAAAHGNPALE